MRCSRRKLLGADVFSLYPSALRGWRQEDLPRQLAQVFSYTMRQHVYDLLIAIRRPLRVLPKQEVL